LAYVITDKCIGEKAAECVAVCPMDCIHPTPSEEGFNTALQLYINPNECIDCYACFEECPVQAIYSDAEVPDSQKNSITENALYYSDKPIQ
jgi:NAD-dependent dihydropyrimidine dehydrogenase PreA subunit